MSEQSTHVDASGGDAGWPPAAADDGHELTPNTSEAVLGRYRSSMRRQRTVYYAILAVLVTAIGVAVAVAWSHGEVSHASLHTVRPAPRNLRVANPSDTVQQAWRSANHAAIGIPQWGGTIVTFSKHTVSGRDARSGKRTWYYTRTDRVVCTAAQLNGVTVAIYQLHGNCDELSAFSSGTGHRRWTRTLDIDGLPLNGRPSYQVVSDVLLIASHRVIYAIDPITGYNRWTYQRTGCRIGSVALGSSGALISQNCSNNVKCENVKFCGRGPQLLLRDKYAARADNSKPNADQIKWNNLGDDSVPVSADDVISSVSRDGTTLYLLDTKQGTARQTLQLASTQGRLGGIAAFPTESTEVIWVGGEMYAVDVDASKPTWQVSTSSAPTVVSSDLDPTPSLSTARITVPGTDGVDTINGDTGKVSRTTATSTSPFGSAVYPLGAGFLVVGADGIVAYQ